MATVTDASLAAAIQLVVETAAALDLDDPQLISYDLLRQYWLDRLRRDLVAVLGRSSLVAGLVEYMSFSLPSVLRPGQSYDFKLRGIS